MHLSRHDEWLPEGVPPAILPDTAREARLLTSLLEIGFLPTATDGGSGRVDFSGERLPAGHSGGERAEDGYQGALPTREEAASEAPQKALSQS